MTLPSARSPYDASPRLRLQTLEDRVTPSWGGTPPAAITLPTSFVPVTLDVGGFASGQDAIINNEFDYYRVTVKAGSATFSATTPGSNLDTVIAVYGTNGRRVAFNDDIAPPTDTDSRTTVTLAAGTYFLGVTNFTGTPGGTYTWTVQSGGVAPPVSGFDITLRTSGLTANQLNAFRQASARWSQAIIGDLPDAVYNGVAVDDVLIDASAVAIDGPGGILGQAGPDALRSGSFLPIHGMMQFDSADLADLEASGQLNSVVFHEMGHVLGFGTIWRQLGVIAGAGTVNTRFTGPQAIAQYNLAFGRSATSVPLESGGGPGTADGHWSEAVFNNEIMTGYINPGSNPLSRVTIASMADLGYRVNLNAADAYTPPAGGAIVAGGNGGTGAGTAARPGLMLASFGGVAFDLPRDRRHTPGDDWNGVSVG